MGCDGYGAALFMAWGVMAGVIVTGYVVQRWPHLVGLKRGS